MKKGMLFLVGAIVLVLGVSLAWMTWPRMPADSADSAMLLSNSASTPRQTPAPSRARGADPKPALAGKSRLARRVDELRRLPTDLSAADVKRVHGMVCNRSLNETTRNAALVALERQQRPAPALGPTLVGIWQDADESDRMRDFALQHLPVVYEHAPNRPAILAVLRDAAGQPASRTMNHAGTAMLSLQRLGSREPGVKEELLELAVKSVVQHARDPEKAVVGLQILRQEQDPAAVAQARRLATDGAAPARLRMSAIGLVATVGDASDLALLTRLLKDDDSRVRRVARFQRNVLQKRCWPDA